MCGYPLDDLVHAHRWQLQHDERRALQPSPESHRLRPILSCGEERDDGAVRDDHVVLRGIRVDGASHGRGEALVRLSGGFSADHRPVELGEQTEVVAFVFVALHDGEHGPVDLAKTVIEINAEAEHLRDDPGRAARLGFGAGGKTKGQEPAQFAGKLRGLPLTFRPEDPFARRTRRVQDRQGVFDEDQPAWHSRHDGSAPLAW